MAALIDADIIAYIASAVAQRSIDWEDGEDPQVIADWDACRRKADEIVQQWLVLSGEEDYILCFTDRQQPNFRYRVHPHYKGQRTTGSKPTMLRKIEKHLRKEYPHKVLHDLEGDDVIGLMATDPERGGDVMVSTDKDMKTVPGMLCRPGKDKRPRRVRPDRADYWWMYQTIMGDKTDNFSGAPGAGPKAAEKALDGVDFDYFPDQPWDAVMAVYDAQFDNARWREKFVTDDPETEAIMNARCARILRHGDYNYDTGKVRLWTP